MNERTKITLSGKELELVCNTELFLTKHRIIEKVYRVFGGLLVSMQGIAADHRTYLPQEIFCNDPKIFKGENYNQLPYVMLDYPRCFAKENTLAIRTFFWWGNFFSINLQLSGKYKVAAIPVLLNNFLTVQQNKYWVCVHDNPWQHYFEPDNYILAANLSKEDFAAILNREPFIKIGKKIPLQQWDEAALFLERSFQEMISLLKY